MPLEDSWLTAERRIEVVQELLQDPPDPLIDWAGKQDITLRPYKKVNWGNLKKRFDRYGMWEAANAYMDQQVYDLMNTYRLFPTRPKSGKAVCKLILIQFVEDRLFRSQKVVQLWGQREVDAEAEKLPGHIRWAFMHPGLSMPEDVREDPVCRSFIDAYERKNPPSSGAANLYYHAAQDAGAREKLFASVAAMMLAERRKKAEILKPEEDPHVAEATLVAGEIDAMLKSYEA